MFDIGFAELLIIAIVGLLVIGPERLPGAIRTGSAWLGRIKRSFNDIKREVEQELHNDAVLDDLKKAPREIHQSGERIQKDLLTAADDIKSVAATASEEVVSELDSSVSDKDRNKDSGKPTQ